MGSLKKRAIKEGHEDRSEEDAKRLTEFLNRTPPDGRELCIGVRTQAVADETRKHLSPEHRKRIRFVVTKEKPEGIPSFKQTRGAVQMPVIGKMFPRDP